MWQGRFRLGHKPWARAKGLDICIFRKNLTWECYSFANIWAVDLKLFGVLCLPKVRQMGIAHLGMRPVRTEAWGQPHKPREVPLLRSGHPCSAGSSSRKRPRPSASLRSTQGGAGQKAEEGFVTSKAHTESPGNKNNLGDKKSDLVSSVPSLVHWLPGQHVAWRQTFPTGFLEQNGGAHSSTS